jgi:hypothetical protein
MEDLPVLDRTAVVKKGVLTIPNSHSSYPLGQLPAGDTVADDLQSAKPDLQIWLQCAVRNLC